MARCPNPTPDNCCRDIANYHEYGPRRPDRNSPAWNKQGIYAIMEPGHTYYRKKMPILYVGRGNISDRLKKHFMGTDSRQKIGKYLLKKKGDVGRFELDGIKVYWKEMSEPCTKKTEEKFIKCIEDTKGYRPRFNKIAGNTK